MSQQVNFVAGKVLSGRVYPEFFPFHSEDVVLNVGAGYAPQAAAYQGHFGRMVGVDIMENRLRATDGLHPPQILQHYHALCADVEQMPLRSASFDKAIAIDIIEHVRNPQALCAEIHRLLKPGGQALITFPALHDHYVAAFSWVGRTLLRRKGKGTFHDASAEWHPDAHNQNHSIGDWVQLVQGSGLHLVRSHATTLFPPLHLYGVPRFWFSQNWIHQADFFLGGLPGLRRAGQGMMGIFQKKQS